MINRSFLTALSLFLVLSCKTTNPSTSLKDGPGRDELKFYEATRILDLRATKNFKDFSAQQGLFVTKRDARGNATEVLVRVLSDNSRNDIKIIGVFNEWGASTKESHILKAVSNSPYYETKITELKHLDQYRLLVNGKQRLDPAANLYTTPEFFEKFRIKTDQPYLNSVFWDFDRPGAYHIRQESVDLRQKPVVLCESEVFELAKKWSFQRRTGPKKKYETYKFIAESNIISELKAAGYNAIEFLPFNQSVDGDHWHFRYQVFGLFAPDSRYGDPDEFAHMIEKFNQAGIAVIMDAVVGHYPYTANSGVRSLGEVGLHAWNTGGGANLYGNHPSPWTTNRFNYANPHIKRFLTDSVLHMMGRYGISGIRFDNLDGIRFYDGPGGGGEAFLKQLVKELRDYRPESFLIAEMFFGENKVLQRIDEGGYGINFRTHSNYFDFIKDNLLEPNERINMSTLRSALRDPWDWREAARVQYITNHDEAANGRNGATGQYIASLIKGPNGGGFEYIEPKTKVFGGLSMLSSTVYMDMPQARLLQEGSFNENSAVDWQALSRDRQKMVYRFFRDASLVMINRPAFAFTNFHGNIENHTDYDNKVISVERIDFTTNQHYYVVANLSSNSIENYRFGVGTEGNYKVLIDSDKSIYGGGNSLANRLPSGQISSRNQSSHSKPHSIELPYLPKYGIVVLGQE